PAVQRVRGRRLQRHLPGTRWQRLHAVRGRHLPGGVPGLQRPRSRAPGALDLSGLNGGVAPAWRGYGDDGGCSASGGWAASGSANSSRVLKRVPARNTCAAVRVAVLTVMGAIKLTVAGCLGGAESTTSTATSSTASPRPAAAERAARSTSG